MAEFLKSNTTLVELVLSNTRMTTSSAKKLLPALQENSHLQHLDLSHNWLNDSTAPVVIDVLRANSSLYTLDLSGNKSMKVTTGGRYLGWDSENRCSKRSPVVDGSRMQIIKGALFDTSSLQVSWFGQVPSNLRVTFKAHDSLINCRRSRTPITSVQ